jgi:type I restriction enzyme S subunit
MKPSGIDWLGDVPAHWMIKRIKHLGSIRYGLGEPPERDDDGIPFIRATDIHAGVIHAAAIQRILRSAIPWQRAIVLQEHDILVVRSGAYTADSSIIPAQWAGSIAGYDMVMRVKHANPVFVGWVLLSNYVRKEQLELESTRAAQPHLNAHELGNAIVLLPPLDEQRTIVAFLERETGKIDKLVARIEDAISRFRQYRSALITAAVTGQIDVRGEVAA